MSRAGSDVDQWLTLEQAARRAGVHPTTLRGWADRGLVRHMRTPGGHRRFSASEIDRLTSDVGRSEHRSLSKPTLFDVGLAFTRERLARPNGVDQALVHRESGESAEARRNEGRQLLGLVMQFITAREEDPAILEAARAMGHGYAKRNRDTGVALRDAVAISQFFRDTLVDAIVEGSMKSGGVSLDTGIAIARVSRVLNQFQLAMIEATMDPTIVVPLQAPSTEPDGTIGEVQQGEPTR